MCWHVSANRYWPDIGAYVQTITKTTQIRHKSVPFQYRYGTGASINPALVQYWHVYWEIHVMMLDTYYAH